jgi:hypothetical protein
MNKISRGSDSGMEQALMKVESEVIAALKDGGEYVTSLAKPETQLRRVNGTLFP